MATEASGITEEVLNGWTMMTDLSTYVFLELRLLKTQIISGMPEEAWGIIGREVKEEVTQELEEEVTQELIEEVPQEKPLKPVTLSKKKLNKLIRQVQLRDPSCVVLDMSDQDMLAKTRQPRDNAMYYDRFCRNGLYFTDNNCLIYVTHMYEGVNGIWNILGAIANDHNLFGFNLYRQPARMLPTSVRETEAEARKNMAGMAPASVCVNQKVGDLTGGSQEDDEEQNGGITGIITKGGEEDDDNSSFTFLQLCTLAISGFLLWFVTLYPKFDKKKAAIPAVGLFTAALASRISLEITPKRPLFARSCGFLAVLSLIVALASFIFS